jgi:hypothetical protein
MGRRTELAITIAACLAAFTLGIAGVTAYAIWDVSKRIA